MEEDESNEDMQSQPNQELTSSTTRDQRTNETNERLPDWPTIPFNEDVHAQLEQLRKDMRKKDEKIDQLQENILQMQEHITTLETTTIPIPIHNKKRKFSNGKLDEEGANEELHNLKKENEELKRRLDELEKPSKQPETTLPVETQNLQEETKLENDTVKFMKMIEEKLSRGFQAIQTNLTNTIDERLNTTNPQSPQRSYASAVGNNRTARVTDLRSIMLANKNEEIEEEKDRQKRVKNIIIHGKVEESGATDDRKFAEDLIKELQIGAPNISQIERIGLEKEPENGAARKRPMKLIMNSEEDKEKVLRNLRLLKGKTIYKSISITADYTYSERQLIKDYRERANIKNDFEEDKDYIWRVRGTPKNGLFLKRVNKAN